MILHFVINTAYCGNHQVGSVATSSFDSIHTELYITRKENKKRGTLKMGERTAMTATSITSTSN